MKVAILSVLGCTLLCSCDLYYSTISVENRTSDDVIRPQIVDGDRHFPLGSISRGKTRSFWRHFPGEGAPSIMVSFRGKTIMRELCYYTGPHTFDAVVTVTDDHIAVRCD